MPAPAGSMAERAAFIKKTVAARRRRPEEGRGGIAEEGETAVLFTACEEKIRSRKTFLMEGGVPRAVPLRQRHGRGDFEKK